MRAATRVPPGPDAPGRWRSVPRPLRLPVAARGLPAGAGRSRRGVTARVPIAMRLWLPGCVFRPAPAAAGSDRHHERPAARQQSHRAVGARRVRFSVPVRLGCARRPGFRIVVRAWLAPCRVRRGGWRVLPAVVAAPVPVRCGRCSLPRFFARHLPAAPGDSGHQATARLRHR
ncbi:hypothetical protein D3C85_1367730 [compost metagenome]